MIGRSQEGQEVIALTADVDTVHVNTFLLKDLDLGQADPLRDLSVRRDREARGFGRSGAGAGGCVSGFGEGVKSGVPGESGFVGAFDDAGLDVCALDPHLQPTAAAG